MKNNNNRNFLARFKDACLVLAEDEMIPNMLGSSSWICQFYDSSFDEQDVWLKGYGNSTKRPQTDREEKSFQYLYMDLFYSLLLHSHLILELIGWD